MNPFWWWKVSLCVEAAHKHSSPLRPPHPPDDMLKYTSLSFTFVLIELLWILLLCSLHPAVSSCNLLIYTQQFCKCFQREALQVFVGPLGVEQVSARNININDWMHVKLTQHCHWFTLCVQEMLYAVCSGRFRINMPDDTAACLLD